MISVVICTHNRSASLERTLDSLAEMSAAGSTAWDVTVVDNASSDSTRQVVDEFVRRSARVDVEYVYEAEPGLSHARNAGIAASTQPIVAFLDDDVTVREDWLDEMRRAFERHHASCVGGRALLRTDVERPTWWHDAYEGKVGHFDRGDEEILSRSADDGLVGIGANLAFRREVFERHGSFRGELGRKGRKLSTGEEVDLMNRLRQAGELAVYWPALVVYHHPDRSRFTKDYLRRWYTSFGEWDYFRQRERADDEIRLLGVPRWKYRTAAGDLLKMARGHVAGRGREAFFAELRLRAFLGYLKAARRE